MALGSCIFGFKAYYRPLIVIDGTYFKKKYKGLLFIATAMNGKNQIFPIAFGVGILRMIGHRRGF